MTNSEEDSLYARHRRVVNYKSRVIFFVMDHLVLKHLAAIFGTSPRQLKAFKVLYPNDVPDFWVPNPVRQFDTVAADPAVTPPTQGRPTTFVSVGRFDYQKGRDILIRAFSLLRRDRPDTRLQLVGFGADEEALRSLIDRLDLTDSVSLEHFPNSPEVPLALSDIYVSASRWEGWSLAICEALRFGLAVVSTDCDFGPSDILTDVCLGRLAPSDDEQALTDAMRYYCDNLAAESAFSDFRKEAIDAYSAENVVHTHAAALKKGAGR